MKLIKREDPPSYPQLYYASDAASSDARNRNLLGLRIQLGLFLGVSVLNATSSLAGPEVSKGLLTLSSFSLAAGLVLMWILRQKGFERIWFDCRAVAESVKTRTWRFMMQAPPYDSLADPQKLDAVFLQELAEISSARPSIEAHIVGKAPGLPSITGSMRTYREMDFVSRKAIYLRERVVNQKNWYEKKAAEIARAGTFWFWGIAVLQIGALGLSVVQTAFAPFAPNPVSLIMTVAATFVAWSQAQRQDELPSAYSLAASELRALDSLAEHVNDDAAFVEFVTQVEDAISREHTMWSARRDHKRQFRVSEEGN